MEPWNSYDGEMDLEVTGSIENIDNIYILLNYLHALYLILAGPPE